MAKKKPEIYEVEVKNWDKWNPDEKTVGWFKLSTNFFDDYAVHSLNANEKLLYLWLLCRCAQIKGSSVKFTRSSLAVHVQFRGSSMVDGLCKLAELGLIILQKERKKERIERRDILKVKTSARPFTHPTNLQEFKDLFPEENWNSWLALYPDMDWIERSLHEAFVYFYVNKTKPPSTTVKDWKARMTNWLKRGWKDYSTQSKPRSGYKSKSRQVTENCKKLWNEIDEDELNEQEQI